jgi:hypothetical protein
MKRSTASRRAIPAGAGCIGLKGAVLDSDVGSPGLSLRDILVLFACVVPNQLNLE